jgi:micrococcal nuclease
VLGGAWPSLVAVSVGGTAGLGACSPVTPSPAADGPNATVVAVIDGDTFDVEISGRRERVRLLGIDTPEVAHQAFGDRAANAAECYGVEAAAFTAGLLPIGAQVRLERDVVGRDHYGRLLAHAHLGNTYVNVEVVRRGYAQPLFIAPNAVNRDVIVAAATAAEADDVGLWSACD